jgi:hypothetical protein
MPTATLQLALYKRFPIKKNKKLTKKGISVNLPQKRNQDFSPLTDSLASLV